MPQPHYLDSHLHLQDPRFDGIRNAVLLRAKQAGVLRMFCNATSEKDWQDVLNLSSDSPSLIPFIGIHPWHCDTVVKDWQIRLGDILETIACGIGETGLDKKCSCDMMKQIEIFTVQLQLAVTYRRPLAVHCVGCWGKLLDILEMQTKTTALPPIMIHSFGGSLEIMQRLVRLGCWLSFSTRLAAPGQERLRQVLQKTPLHHILLETDAPDQLQAGIDAGSPEDSVINEPANIIALYALAANLQHMNLQDFCREIWQNGTIFTDSTLPR